VSKARVFESQVFQSIVAGRSATPGIPGYSGFSQPLGIKPGQEAWVPWLSAGSGTLALREYLTTEAHQLVFRSGQGERRRIPSPFVRRKSATYGLVAGQPVLSPFAAHSSYGRISAVCDQRVLVDHVTPNTVGCAELSLYEVIPVDGSAHFGAPVVYRSGTAWGWGQLLSVGGQTCWILSSAGRIEEISAAAARPLTQKRFLPGERVSALHVGTMQPATVRASLHKGVTYALRFDGCSGDEVRNYSQVGQLLR
jgi:hypothetical protein